MFIYVFPYVALFFLLLLIMKMNIKNSNLFLLLFLFLIPAILVVILRGNVGTDTINYLGFFRDLSNEQDVHEYEPGFQLLSKFIIIFGFNERINIAIVSFLTILILCKSFSYSKEHVLVFSSFLFPVFFYDMTMNGLRYGLSFALSSVAIDALYRKKNISFIILALFSLSIQYSSFFIIFIFLAFKLNKKMLLILLTLIIISIPLIIDFFVKNINYFYDKQDFYKDVASPSGTSGLGPLLLFCLLLFAFCFFSKNVNSKKIIVLIFILEIGSFMLAKITYAGLRLQMLFLFSLLLLIKEEYDCISKKREFMVFIISLGFFGFLLTAKNLTANVEDVESPFIPYKFFWQEND
jgi:hypothetical protein